MKLPGSIRGIGIDVVDLARFEEALTRTPGLLDRLFTENERGLPHASLAARFAAKEALAKALGVPPGLQWRDAEVCKDPSGRPFFSVRGGVADAVANSHIHLTLSHDGGIASAFVILEER
jgi:holo-[acyl-carrier protein] synthase